METTLTICLIIACVVIIIQHLLIRKSYSDLEHIKESLTNIRKEVDEYGKIEEDYNKLVDKHNKLVEEHNELVSEYKKVVTTYNELLKDFKKSKGYNGYLADINEYLLGLQTFNKKSAQMFEDFCQESADKHDVENIIKKEENENE